MGSVCPRVKYTESQMDHGALRNRSNMWGGESRVPNRSLSKVSRNTGSSSVQLSR